MSVEVRAEHRRRSALAVAALGILAAAAACSAPGTPQAQSTAGKTATSAASATAGCGTAPVTMDAYIETGFQVPNSLMAEFTKQYPNVKWNIRQDQFAVITQNAPRVLAGDPPDLMRLPSISDLVKDGLLKNLDGYCHGLRLGQVAQLASSYSSGSARAAGRAASGSLYAMGLNYSMTGVFYNKTARGEDRDDLRARDARRTRRGSSQGQGGRHHADRPVQRRGHGRLRCSRCRT